MGGDRLPKPTLTATRTESGLRDHGGAMVRRSLTLLMVVLFLTGSLIMTSNAWVVGARASARHPHGPCNGRRIRAIRPELGTTRVVSRVRDLLLPCVYRHWPTPGGLSYLRYICDRESSYWPWAHSPTGALGLFQHVSTYWPGRARTYLRRRWVWTRWIPVAYDPRANAIVTARMVRAGGWGPWGG